VAGEQPVGLLRRLLVDLLQSFADLLVQLPPLRVDEARVRDLLHEPVTEPVLGIGPAALLVDEVEPLELGQGRDQLVARDEALEKGDAEGAPDHRGDGQHLARRRIEPVEPGLERALDESRDRQLVLVHRERPLAVVALQGPALDEVADRLLEEEGITPRALGEELCDRVRNLASGGADGEHAARVGRQRLHLDLLVAVGIALAGALPQPPGAELALAAIEEEEAHGGLLGHAQERLEELQRRLVGPVQVFEDDGERPLLRELADQLVEHLEGPRLNRFAVQLPDPLSCVRLEGQAQQAREEGVALVRLVTEEVGKLRLQLEAHAGLRRRGSDVEPLAQEA
jgi:hypothetical protein